MKKFVLHWLDGKKETIEGDDIADACRRAGIGRGALNALDYYKKKPAASRMLFLTLTTLVYKIKNGSVQSTDLDRGLFFMGCTRTLAYDFDHERNPVRKAYSSDLEEGARVHLMLTSAWRKAEEDGRIHWRERAEDLESYDALNQFLVTNGYADIPIDVGDQKTHHFNLSGATLRIEKVELDLDLVA